MDIKMSWTMNRQTTKLPVSDFISFHGLINLLVKKVLRIKSNYLNFGSFIFQKFFNLAARNNLCLFVLGGSLAI